MDGATLDAQGGYISDSGKISLVGSVISSGIATFEGTYISGGFLELNKAKIDGSGVLNLSRLQITTVPRGQERLSPLKLDEAEISGGTVNLERIRITKGEDQVESIWSGGKEKGGGQFVASLRKLVINDGRVSFKDTEIPFGELSFGCGRFFGGVLDFECAKLEDCYLNFNAGRIKGSCLNFSNSFIGVPLHGDILPHERFVCEWLKSLENTERVQDRDMVFKKKPDAELVVEFAEAELSSGHLNFDHAEVRGAFLGFPGIRTSGGKITFTKSLFYSSAISFWNADLHDECAIEIQPYPNLSVQDVTVLYSQAYAGLNGRVTLGKQVKLLEVSSAD